MFYCRCCCPLPPAGVLEAAASIEAAPAAAAPTQVPTAHGKADLTLYRSEGSKVLAILARLGAAERASIGAAAAVAVCLV